MLRHPYFRRAAQAVMFLLAAAIVADGLFGPQVSAMNLAGVLPWTHWRALAVLALLIGGNFFCMACPFTLPRDFARRFLPARRLWPKQLRSKWTAVGLTVLYLWAYEAFSLWDSPWWTAWIVVGYFATALLVDGLFQGASFCKYVCPIGQFHFVNSMVSPLEVRVREPKVCGSCQTHDCLHGSARQRGCELYLFQPKKAGNFDCTFCLDCVHACPSDNVGILATLPRPRVRTSRAARRRGARVAAGIRRVCERVGHDGAGDPMDERVAGETRVRIARADGSRVLFRWTLYSASLGLGPFAATLARPWNHLRANACAARIQHVDRALLVSLPDGMERDRSRRRPSAESRFQFASSSMQVASLVASRRDSTARRRSLADALPRLARLADRTERAIALFDALGDTLPFCSTQPDCGFCSSRCRCAEC